MKRPGINRKHTCRASWQLAFLMAAQREARRPFGQVLADWLRPLWLRRFARWVLFKRAA